MKEHGYTHWPNLHSLTSPDNLVLEQIRMFVHDENEWNERVWMNLKMQMQPQ